MTKLLTVNDCWADEVDFNSHLIVEDGDENSKMLERIKTYTQEEMQSTRSVSIGIGSNEDMEYKNAYEAFYSIREYDITPEERETIHKYFGDQAGALSIDYFLEYILQALGCEED